MGRYTGPVEKLSRREGVELGLKGERLLAGKSALERRGAVPPGGLRGGRRSQSPYADRLREKQRVKRLYGVRERQFLRYFRAADRQRDMLTGHALLRLLESRLDNVVFRLGLASTRAQARQFVAHRHVLLNGRRADIPSMLLAPGDELGIAPDSPVEPVVRAATELTARIPAWLLADHDALGGAVVRLPERHEIEAPVDERLVVEFYARG